MRSFDLIVIGGGPAGESAALTAANLGKRVAIVEKDGFLGGASVNTGTVPSKTLRETALALSGLRSRGLHGVDLSLRRHATVADLLHHERAVKLALRSQINRILSVMMCYACTARRDLRDQIRSSSPILRALRNAVGREDFHRDRQFSSPSQRVSF